MFVSLFCEYPSPARLSFLYAAETDMPLPEALKLGACSAAASLSEVSASDGVKAKDEVLNLYELYGKK